MYRKEKGHVLVLNQQYGDEIVTVTRDEVAGYVEAQDFLYFLSIYQYTKLWGMPNGDGWANEPTEILDGITALELEAKAIEAEQYKDKKHSSGKNLGARRESI